jgi:hypothetical protein
VSVALLIFYALATWDKISKLLHQFSEIEQQFNRGFRICKWSNDPSKPVKEQWQQIPRCATGATTKDVHLED